MITKNNQKMISDRSSDHPLIRVPGRCIKLKRLHIYEAKDLEDGTK